MKNGKSGPEHIRYIVKRVLRRIQGVNQKRFSEISNREGKGYEDVQKAYQKFTDQIR